MRLFTGRLLLAVMLASSPFLVQAQDKAAPAAKPQLSEQQKQILTKLQQTQAEFQKTQVAIKELEEKTLKKSPGLQKKKDALENMIDKKMNSGGYNAKAEAKALQEIVKKYQGTNQRPPENVLADFQKRQMALQQKQQTVMQDKEVQGLMKDFNENLLTEAKKVDPNTDALLMRMQDQINHMQKLRQELQASMTK